jgi:HK97 family phage major capsid protein
MTLQEMRQKFAANETAYSAILQKGDGVSAEELQNAEALLAENEGLREQIAKTTDLHTRATALTSWSSASPTPVTHSATPPTTQAGGATPKKFAIPARLAYSRVRNFKDRDGQSAAERAYAFGRWFFATSYGHRPSQQWCVEHGVDLTAVGRDGTILGQIGATNLAHTEVINTQGGFLVAPQFETDLIDLREQFGVVRGLFRNRPMSSDAMSIPRRTGGLTAYFVSDNEAITESTKSWDQVNLSAKKIGVLSKVSSELSEDAFINVADDLAGEIAYAFSELEDGCGLIGDGSTTYGGMVGITQAFLNLSATRANIAGLFVGTGNLWSELTLADHNFVKAKLPKYANNNRTRWLCSQQYWAGVMERLALAAGGITDAMIAAGYQPRFLGFPVVISQKMPTAEANDHIPALLGDFTLAAAFGDRRQTTIAMSEHSSFANDVLDIRGTERFDINVHDIGNASGTAALRVAGPVVGLLTAAS